MCLRACAEYAGSHYPVHDQGSIRAFLSMIHSIVSFDSVSGQRRPCSDCADAQADLGLRWPHMPKDAFSHGAAHFT